jgi:hypothetical protein
MVLRDGRQVVEMCRIDVRRGTLGLSNMLIIPTC